MYDFKFFKENTIPYIEDNAFEFVGVSEVIYTTADEIPFKYKMYKHLLTNTIMKGEIIYPDSLYWNHNRVCLIGLD